MTDDGDIRELDMDGRRVITSIIVPPVDDHCDAGLCGQKACCSVVFPDRDVPADDSGGRQAFVLSLCEPHATHVLAVPLQEAADMHPPDLVGDTYPEWLGGDAP